VIDAGAECPGEALLLAERQSMQAEPDALEQAT